MKKNKEKLTSNMFNIQLEGLREMIDLSNLPKFFNTSNINIAEVSKKENILVEKIHDVVKQECNPEQLMFYTFLKITDKKNKDVFFVMIQSISQKQLYPYDDAKILSIKYIDNAIDVVFEIIASYIGLRVDRKLVKKTFLELQKQLLNEEFLNPYLKQEEHCQSWILNCDFEEFLLKLVFSPYHETHTNKLLIKKFVALIKLNLQLSLS